MIYLYNKMGGMSRSYDLETSSDTGLINLQLLFKAINAGLDQKERLLFSFRPRDLRLVFVSNLTLTCWIIVEGELVFQSFFALVVENV